jgi:hypothetical protein
LAKWSDQFHANFAAAKQQARRSAVMRSAGNPTMRRIRRVEVRQVDLEPKVVRTDAIQAFVRQETLLVTVTDEAGQSGTGYAYTIGTGGSSVLALLHDHFAPRLIGRFHTHATAVGAITSLALAAVDTALWDWRARSLRLPLWQLLGGAQPRVPVYTTEGGWLHLETAQLVDQTMAAQAAGFRGAKIKVGRPHVSDDVARLAAVRDAVGMLDRAGRRCAHRRYHAMAQGRAPGRNFQRSHLPAFPDGIARRPVCRRAECALGRIHSTTRRHHA